MLDLIDRKILGALMTDATTPIARIGDRVGLSQTPCWKRIQKLESTGVITGRVALVDPLRIGLPVTAFVGIEAPDHSPDWRETFQTAISQMPEVMEVYRIAGGIDYLLRVAVSSMNEFDAFYHRLTAAVPIRTVTSHFAMERVKATTAWPINTTDR